MTLLQLANYRLRGSASAALTFALPATEPLTDTQQLAGGRDQIDAAIAGEAYML